MGVGHRPGAALLAVLVFVACLLPRTAGGQQTESARMSRLRAAIERLRPLHEPLGEPLPGDWLFRFDEPGQTFDEYRRCDPVVPHAGRAVIYVQPMGEFTEKQNDIITLTTEYMRAFFSVPVRVTKGLPLSLVPGNARRRPACGEVQILTRYVLKRVLEPRLPSDAAAYIGFTASDLWPGKGWSYVFGQAWLRGRVGVWSLHRFGDPHESEEGFRLCLRRTMKLATHETGHMLSMRHCIRYECNMCGCNDLEESDRHPLWLCPECMAKVCWATRADPVERYRRLSDMCRSYGFEAEAAFFEKSIEVLTAP